MEAHGNIGTMRTRGTSLLLPRGGCWPNPEQELLLRAAIFQGERSIHGWHLWKKGTDIETNTLDIRSFRAAGIKTMILKEAA